MNTDLILICRNQLLKSKTNIECNIKNLKSLHFSTDNLEYAVVQIDNALAILLSLLSDNAPNTAGGDSSVKPNK